MSSISSQIAASAAQGLVQQADVARKKDAVKKHDEEQAQKLRDLFEQHVHAVEDSAQTDENRQRVCEDENGAGGEQAKAEQQASDDSDGIKHIDVEA